MRVLQPRTLDEALALRAAHPDAVPIAGGTDVMVALTTRHARPELLLDLGRITEMARWETADRGRVDLGAATSYTRLAEEHAERLPGLAMAARGVGSRQVRNRGTIGGCLGTAAPAGDLHPLLLAVGADIELRSTRGARWLPVRRFYHDRETAAFPPDELITRVRLPLHPGPQHFVKIGLRAGLVKTICSVAVCVDIPRRRVGVGVGGYGPRPCAATAAEEFLADELDAAGSWDSRDPLAAALPERFAHRVTGAAEPTADLRAGAAYRRHALGVLARRALHEVWNAYREAGS